MGMPKFGSTSLEYLFSQSIGRGNVSHWECSGHGYCGVCMRNIIVAESSETRVLEACGNFQFFAEMDYVDNKGTCIFPQIEYGYMDRLYQDSPDAMWLLPFRNTSDWLRSVSNWGEEV